MSALAKAFNALPRPEKTPGGLTSHWNFSIRHVPLEPPGDLIQIINPQSRFIHNAGPRQILALPTYSAKADVVVALLLESFVAGLNRGPKGEKLDDLPLFAPWSWSTKDVELAKAVKAQLEALGVCKELCEVKISDEVEEKIGDSVWDGFMGELQKSMGDKLKAKASPIFVPGQNDPIKCGGCKRGSSTFTITLKKCSGCGEAYYCSTQCQKKDWKHHKKVCKKAPKASLTQDIVGAETEAEVEAPALEAGMEEEWKSEETKMEVDPKKPMPPHYYWNSVAKTVPEAVELAKEIGLTIGGQGLMRPIRRLILTGKDTPENFSLLLGVSWTRETSTITSTRLSILLDPPVGSPDYTLNYDYDKDAPFKAPRPASKEEEKKIKEVRDMQEMVKGQLKGKQQPSTQDMVAIMGKFGREWDKVMPVYTLAVNAMDQGVEVRK